MSLIDTLDGILMLGAYGWAFAAPLRKLYYNMTITLVSALAALSIGGVEALGLIGSKLDLHGAFWSSIFHLNASFSAFGWFIVALFAAGWIGSVALYRYRGWDRLEAEAGIQ
jgi:high-affinity nickel-transport protein